MWASTSATLVVWAKALTDEQTLVDAVVGAVFVCGLTWWLKARNASVLGPQDAKHYRRFGVTLAAAAWGGLETWRALSNLPLPAAPYAHPLIAFVAAVVIEVLLITECFIQRAWTRDSHEAVEGGRDHYLSQLRTGRVVGTMCSSLLLVLVVTAVLHEPGLSWIFLSLFAGIGPLARCIEVRFADLARRPNASWAKWLYGFISARFYLLPPLAAIAFQVSVVNVTGEGLGHVALTPKWAAALIVGISLVAGLLELNLPLDLVYGRLLGPLLRWRRVRTHDPIHPKAYVPRRPPAVPRTAHERRQRAA